MADHIGRHTDEKHAPERDLPPSEVASPAERQADHVVKEPATPRPAERDVTRDHLHGASASEELAGESVGGATGVLAGAALGSIGGPVGSVIGAIAGAIGGWWLGKGVTDAANDYTPELDARFRSHYESSPQRIAGCDYERVRPAYIIGHLASRNPEYRGRPFEAIEPELRRGWESQRRMPETSHPGESAEDVEAWPAVRHFALEAYLGRQLGEKGSVTQWESGGPAGL